MRFDRIYADCSMETFSPKLGRLLRHQRIPLSIFKRCQSVTDHLAPSAWGILNEDVWVKLPSCYLGHRSFCGFKTQNNRAIRTCWCINLWQCINLYRPVSTCTIGQMSMWMLVMNLSSLNSFSCTLLGRTKRFFLSNFDYGLLNGVNVRLLSGALYYREPVDDSSLGFILFNRFC